MSTDAQVEGSFRDAMASFLTQTRALAAANRTLDAVRALSASLPCERWRPRTCLLEEGSSDPGHWCLPCRLRAALTPKARP